MDKKNKKFDITNISNLDINVADNKYILTKSISNPIWLTVSESAKIGGVQTKTVRRAIQQKKIKYKIIKNRYFIDFASFVIFLHSKTKLKNKLKHNGLGQYIRIWEN